MMRCSSAGRLRIGDLLLIKERELVVFHNEYWTFGRFSLRFCSFLLVGMD